MRLRKLEQKDALPMLEWMHDQSVVEKLQTDFSGKNLADCENFIRAALADRSNLHLAVVDDEDHYMGTVSLKHITKEHAEFAISMRRAAMGKGYAGYAMREMIQIGFRDMNLKQIYWCVSPENKRAVRFYTKHNYSRVEAPCIDEIRGGIRPSRFPGIGGTWSGIKNSHWRFDFEEGLYSGRIRGGSIKWL